MSIELLLPAVTIGAVGAAIGAAVLGRRDTDEQERRAQRKRKR